MALLKITSFWQMQNKDDFAKNSVVGGTDLNFNPPKKPGNIFFRTA
jgi:hypothetical protein